MTKDGQIAALTIQVEQLTVQLQLALFRIQELEQRLNKNSRNSDKPPSSDGLSKKPAIARERGQRKPGGQSGHTGKTLTMIDTAHEYVLHPVSLQRCKCGHYLSEVTGQPDWDRRQVFDLPPTLLKVVEHTIECKTCPGCQRVHRADFPSGVNAPVQYGDRVRSLAVLMNVEHSLPLARIQEFFAGLTGYAINESTVQSAVDRLYDQLAQEEDLILQAVHESKVAHSDETGGRIEGKTQWIHGFSSLLHTFYLVSKQRGGLVINGPESHLANYGGRLIHDCLNSYLAIGEPMKHGLCNAHLLRELTALAELPQALTWPRQMHTLLMDYYRASNHGKDIADTKTLRKLDKRYDKILSLANKEEPVPPLTKKAGKRGRVKKSKGRNLMDRLKIYREPVLAFARQQEVPFTNNLGERDLRPWKTKLKVSGGFRTLKGAQRYARIKGFCSTVKKHGLVVFDQLLAATNGKSFLRLT